MDDWLTEALKPKSDQLDFADLEGQAPQVFTITAVSQNGGELADQQPVNVRLAELPKGKVWRPSKGMLRVMADAWGKATKDWVGKQVELYGDPEVYFGREKRGGTRISRLSHITARQTTLVNPRGGKGAYHAVDPLPAPQPQAPADPPMTAATRDRFFALFAELHPHPKPVIVQAQLDYIGEALGKGGPAPSLSVVTESMAQQVVAALEAERDELAAEAQATPTPDGSDEPATQED